MGNPSEGGVPIGKRLALMVGVWTLIAVLLTGQALLIVYSGELARNDLPQRLPQFTLTELFLNLLAECWIWAGLTVLVFWLGRRFPFGQGHWLRSLAVHVPACLAVAFVHTALGVWATDAIRRDLPRPSLSANVMLYFFIAKFNNNLFFYWAILALGHIVNYHRRWRERELRASQLETQLAQAHLQALKAQLHPHFLFNTLNAIAALMHRDVELADRMLARLGDLLRATLASGPTQHVSLRQELEFIQAYLEIERARLGPRLSVDYDIDPAAMDAQVPNLLLQPLVENAVRHGVAPRTEPGRIAIGARRDNGCLKVSVSDDGPGLTTPLAPAGGIGLANTRARLETLYGAGQRFELSNGPERGLRVDITIPFQEATPAVETGS